MCGYIEYEIDSNGPIHTPDPSGLFTDILPKTTKQYYPAFHAYRPIDIVIQQSGQYKSVEAIWWYDAEQTKDGLIPGRRTTFNARNLKSNYWASALKYHRAIVFGTGLGESKLVGKTKHQYYMKSDRLFALAALYREFPNGQYSAAVITQDSHPKMELYHDKAFPCFMPTDGDFLKLWLDTKVTKHPEIDYLFDNPTLYPTLQVQRVKTYKERVPYKHFEPVTLASDIY